MMEYTLSRPMMLRPFPLLIKSKISGIISNKDVPNEVLIRMLTKFRSYLNIGDNPFTYRGDGYSGVLDEKDIEEIEEDCFLAELLIGLETRNAAFEVLQRLITKIEAKYMGALLVRKRFLEGGDVGDLERLGSNEMFIIASKIM